MYQRRGGSNIWFIFYRFLILQISFQDIYIGDEEMDNTIDLRPYMNPSPYTAQHVSNVFDPV